MTDYLQATEVAPSVNKNAPVAVAAQKCPECGSEMPVYQGYVTWCDHCMWNVASDQTEEPRSFFEDVNLKLSKRLGKRLFEQLAMTPVLKSTLNLTKIAAFLVALLVNSVTVIFFLVGAAIVIYIPFTASILFAVILLGNVWIMRPHFAKLPKENIATREQYPYLYSLAENIAESLKAESVDMIVLDSGFNASFHRAGWMRQSVLTIGLPLFEILDPQERTALLAHEIGHSVNGDVTRGFVVNWALNALSAWYIMWFLPDIKGVKKSIFARLFSRTFGAVFGQIPRFWIKLLALLLFRDHQEAEYLADHLAAEVAGTTGVLGLLRKLHMGDSVYMTIQRFYLNGSKGDIFETIKTQTLNVPPREVARLDKVERLEEARLDATHPPTPYRIDLLNARPVREPKIVLSEAENGAINNELAQIKRDEQSQMLTRMDSAHYY